MYNYHPLGIKANSLARGTAGMHNSRCLSCLQLHVCMFVHTAGEFSIGAMCVPVSVCLCDRLYSYI